jgi:hypothetical protein
LKNPEKGRSGFMEEELLKQVILEKKLSPQQGDALRMYIADRTARDSAFVSKGIGFLLDAAEEALINSEPKKLPNELKPVLDRYDKLVEKKRRAVAKQAQRPLNSFRCRE